MIFNDRFKNHSSQPMITRKVIDTYKNNTTIEGIIFDLLLLKPL
jgi:hypothetical protein